MAKREHVEGVTSKCDGSLCVRVNYAERIDSRVSLVTKSYFNNYTYAKYKVVV